MAKLLASCQRPKDSVAFDCYYFEKHVPLAKTIPVLRRYEVTRGDAVGMAGKHTVCLVGILEFDSMESIGAAMVSPQGQAAAADLTDLASVFVDVLKGKSLMVGLC
jgi:uncharacterized protein (TIGR02118 family)